MTIHILCLYSSGNINVQTLAGKCMVHKDDNFDGRIRTSQLDPTPLTQNDCLHFSRNVRIVNCQYTTEGLCTYQLTRLDNVAHKRYNCIITNIGKYISYI